MNTNLIVCKLRIRAHYNFCFAISINPNNLTEADVENVCDHPSLAKDRVLPHHDP